MREEDGEGEEEKEQEGKRKGKRSEEKGRGRKGKKWKFLQVLSTISLARNTNSWKGIAREAL